MTEQGEPVLLEVRVSEESILTWQTVMNYTWRGIIPAVSGMSPLFRIYSSKHLPHWAAQERLRWTLESDLPGLEELAETADTSVRDWDRAPETLMLQAEEILHAYALKLLPGSDD